MSSPRPVNIRPPILNDDSNNNNNVSRSFASSVDIRNNLRAQYSGTPPLNIPPRSIGNTPRPGSSSPALSSTPLPNDASPLRPAPRPTTTAARGSGSGSGSPMIPSFDLDDLPDEEKAKILRRHLVSREERDRELQQQQDELAVPAMSRRSSNSQRSSGNATPDRTVLSREDSEPFPIPYHAPGADVTHDIYKWHSNAQRQAARVRSQSFHIPSTTQPADPAFEHIHEPGGFRRNYVLLRANEQGLDEPPRVLNNFIDFLFLYGHFAGEDLEEDEEDEEKEDEEQQVAGPSSGPSAGFGEVDETETSPLLGGKRSHSRSLSRSRSRRRATSVSHGNATVTQAVLMLLKGFVGTGVLFLGKAFFNGGILFSSLVFIFIAVISLHSFLLLVKAKLVVPGSFGDIGGALYGNWMRQLILGSIVISQVGFVGAYIIFVAENLQSFVLGVTNCVHNIPVRTLILVQTLVFLPLSLVRDIAKLSTTALIADAFIVAGLIYIFGSEISLIVERGTREVQLVNWGKASLFVGTAVFSFEGIGLIVPITDSMREPRKFPKVLTGVMAFLLVLFGGAGILAYLTFGSEIHAVVLVNLNPASKMVQAVQVLYSLAIMLSVPLQLFPAIKILENGIFVRSGKGSVKVKWLKNVFRFLIVFITAGLAILGAKDLDKFVALVGCFACVPLCYVYPAMLHYRACAHSRKQKVADMAMIVFGLATCVFTTVQTVQLIATPSEGEPGPGVCEPPTTADPNGLGAFRFGGL
ncbi:hypothetical protein WG66_004323 [Moniliophthora roreri]|uniref:Putative vacuolar amino acid transporter 4 n=1 Tax=Moniliophthora roreri TaxID=221103 RepID=A0A0W0G392_MONRR|nr:hypothetical protein WG66_004323 [Moniliophthora roreri]